MSHKQKSPLGRRSEVQGTFQLVVHSAGGWGTFQFVVRVVEQKANVRVEVLCQPGRFLQIVVDRRPGILVPDRPGPITDNVDHQFEEERVVRLEGLRIRCFDVFFAGIRHDGRILSPASRFRHLEKNRLR